jgi:hypothetical protein
MPKDFLVKSCAAFRGRLEDVIENNGSHNLEKLEAMVNDTNGEILNENEQVVERWSEYFESTECGG